MSVSQDELKNLIEVTQAPCISIYIPTQKAGPEVRQNPIRFKNLMREAEEHLHKMGLDQDAIASLLTQAQELDTAEFWENQDNSLAIFISPEIFRHYSLPQEFEELVVVTDSFHLKPLLQLVNNDGLFYLLTLSQNEAKFFEGTRYSIKQIGVENLPSNLDEALEYDETAKDNQQEIATPKGGTGNSAQQPGSFHGQGAEGDNAKSDILQFFHTINNALAEILKNKKAPLVLAGVEYLFPLYQEANTYQHLVEEGITGNPENLQPEELHEQALKLVEPLFEQEQQKAIEHYHELAGSDNGKASHDLKEIISSAYFQRVDSLFVAVGEQKWGHFKPDTNTVDLHDEPQADDQDLLDFAAIHTILNGGKVYAVEPDKVPDNVPIAAIFRY
ncbi:hypothetical protein Cri9333_1233 [Crinalium epipsammum PCC 9333]|uniref:Uncharacterized protein n=1 Tax=Crinalium epipsammum PCC 9333 TaxID=1173022 RepID=K9VX56_9CYAN|nr:hypothetical protein [Crinalium epipsammum]AFZ12134.1 hypothetical protein Cri9333_1233 [Crinalium epipsammum PCC 9333]